VATQILALDGAGGAEHYNGDYTEYHDWKAARKLAVAEAAQQAAKREKSAAAASGSRKTNEPRKSQQKKKTGRDSQAIEAEIAEVEKNLARLSEQLGAPQTARDASLLKAVTEEYQAADTRLKELYEEWERVSAETASA